MVAVLVVFVAFAVIQVALTLHIRNVLISSASEGAHLAAMVDRGPEQGEARALALAASAIGAGYQVDAVASPIVIDGRAAVSIEVSAPIPVLGLWGAGSMSVSARAIEEPSDA